MSDDKGSLDYFPIYSFLFSNEKGSSLYNAYDQDQVDNKLVIKIDQDDDISEVYGLPGIHECINGQKPLRAVIDIDASKEDMEIVSVMGQELERYSQRVKLVYTLTDEKYGKFIDQKLSGQNFNLRLIGSAKKGRVKRILQFSLDNG
ncbi:10901_t:CDS:2, partial [Funneliformis geosporum]